MQGPVKYEVGEEIGCFEVIAPQINVNGANTQGGYNIWICKCTHTNKTCNEWKPSCNRIQRTTKQLNRNAPARRCGKGRLVTITKTNAMEAGFFSGYLDSKLGLDVKNLGSSMSRYYSSHLDGLDIKGIEKLFEAMYDDLFVNWLNHSQGSVINKHVANSLTIDWKPIVDKYVTDITGQISLWNALIAELSKNDICKSIIAFIEAELKRMYSVYKWNYPDCDNFTAWAMKINTVKEDFVERDEDEVLIFRSNPDNKKEYVRRFVTILKNECADTLSSQLVAGVFQMAAEAVKNNSYSTRVIGIDQVGLDAEIVFDSPVGNSLERKVRVYVTKQPYDNVPKCINTTQQLPFEKLGAYSVYVHK